MTSALPYLVPLAKELDENKVTPGVLGFIVFAALGGAVWLLMKSMNKQFGKIDFEEREDDRAQAGEKDDAAAEAAGEPVGSAVGTAGEAVGTAGGGGAGEKSGGAEAEAGRSGAAGAG